MKLTDLVDQLWKAIEADPTTRQRAPGPKAGPPRVDKRCTECERYFWAGGAVCPACLADGERERRELYHQGR